MELSMARGAAAMAATREVLDELIGTALDELIGTATAADGAFNHDHKLAAALSRRELDILRAAEARIGHRLHKGHALHNLGAATLAADQEQARTYFHAAFVEDARTAEADEPDLSSTVSGQTLAEMYGEPSAMLGRLLDLARDTTTDPLEVATAFEAEEQPLPEYRGFRSYWRELGSLDTVPPERLVFVGGSYAFSDRIHALSNAVRDAGLEPVIVREFVDFADAFAKSETLLERCGAGVFDISYAASGWVIELVLARRLKTPIWAGHVAWTGYSGPYLWPMTEGLLDAMGVKPTATTDTGTMRREASVWLRRQPGLRRVVIPGTDGPVMLRPNFDPTTPAAGTATGYRGLAAGSNADYGRYLDQPIATTSGWSLPPLLPSVPLADTWSLDEHGRLRRNNTDLPDPRDLFGRDNAGDKEPG